MPIMREKIRWDEMRRKEKRSLHEMFVWFFFLKEEKRWKENRNKKRRHYIKRSSWKMRKKRDMKDERRTEMKHLRNIWTEETRWDSRIKDEEKNYYNKCFIWF